jgi:hypothetical protein
MPDLPEQVIAFAIAATRAARRGTHPDPSSLRSRRDDRLARHGYRARVREDRDGPVLVCYPDSWIEDGTVRPSAVESTADAIERPLWGEAEAAWDAIAAHNRALAETVGERHGQVHAANVAAFGTYLANHHEARIEHATATQVETFLAEYFPRNAWPSDEQRATVENSLEYVFELVDPPAPLPDRSA